MKRFLTILFSIVLIGGLLAVPGGSARADAAPRWKQVNAAPNPAMATITSFEEFKGMLYAGTSATVNWPDYLDDATQSAVYRSKDGARWEQVSAFGFGDTFNNKHVWALTVFKGQLYAGTGGFGYDPEHNQNYLPRHAQIWRSSDGVTWQAVNTDGFGDPFNMWVDNLVVYRGAIYSISTPLFFGFQIYRSQSGDPGTWTKVTTMFDDPSAFYFSDGVTTFDGKLYLASEFGGSRAQIYTSSNGTDWNAANSENFGLTEQVYGGGGIGVYKGSLYAGLGTPAGGQIWKSPDGKNWKQIMTGGFGNANNWNVSALIPFDGDLYALTTNGTTGAEVWASHNGVDWQQVNQDGFNGICTADACNNNAGGAFSVAGLVYKNALYLGTTNLAGGQIWRLSKSDH